MSSELREGRNEEESFEGARDFFSLRPVHWVILLGSVSDLLG